MCDCIEQIKSRFKEHFADKYPTMTSVCFTEESMLLDKGTARTVLGQPIAIHYTKVFKGAEKDRVETVYVTPTYCPFCGKPVKPEAKEGEDA